MSVIREIRLLTLVVLEMVSSFLSSAQQVRITVSLGQDRAEYSFVKVNDDYLGVCDAKGELTVDASMLKDGDRLKADFAGLSSGAVEYVKNIHDYTLKIPTRELKTSNVSDKEVFLLKEYLKAIRKFSFQDPGFGQKYRFHFDMDFSVAQPETSLKDSSWTELSVIHENGPEDPPVFWETYGVPTDTVVTTGVATAWLYAMELFWYFHNSKALMSGAEDRSILLHKVIADNGNIHYAIIEGTERNNQTIICLDASDGAPLSIKRAFIGSGTLVETTPRTSHDIELVLKHIKKTVSIDSVKLSIHVPEVNDTRTIIDIDSIQELKMTSQEKDVSWKRIDEYVKNRRKLEEE